jgi:cell division protein FtsB
MKFTRADFSHLKWSLLVFLLVILGGAIAIAGGIKYSSQAQREQLSAQNQLSAARNQLAAANEDLQNMQAYTTEYAELLKRNIIDNDQRLDWIEGLEKIRKLNRVLDFKFTIAPQHVYTAPVALDRGNFELDISEMTLQLDLLHEQQLMDFFDTLHADTKGWFILNHCAMERIAAPDANARLKAECTGGWLTLKHRSTS